MRLGILGDIHGYLPGSDRMCIDFAVHLTTALCGHAHFFREARTATSTVYSLNQLKDEYYILDTSSWTLARFPSRGLV